MAITLSDAGCDPSSVTVKPGETRFVVTNSGSTKVTRFIIGRDGKTLGQTDKVTPQHSRTLSLVLDQGAYEMRCPNGTAHDVGSVNVSQNSGDRTTTSCPPNPVGGYGGNQCPTDTSAPDVTTQR